MHFLKTINYFIEIKINYDNIILRTDNIYEFEFALEPKDIEWLDKYSHQSLKLFVHQLDVDEEYDTIRADILILSTFNGTKLRMKIFALICHLFIRNPKRSIYEYKYDRTISLKDNAKAAIVSGIFGLITIYKCCQLGYYGDLLVLSYTSNERAWIKAGMSMLNSKTEILRFYDENMMHFQENMNDKKAIEDKESLYSAQIFETLLSRIEHEKQKILTYEDIQKVQQRYNKCIGFELNGMIKHRIPASPKSKPHCQCFRQLKMRMDQVNMIEKMDKKLNFTELDRLKETIKNNTKRVTIDTFSDSTEDEHEEEEEEEEEEEAACARNNVKEPVTDESIR